jgi:hypothetical protein
LKLLFYLSLIICYFIVRNAIAGNDKLRVFNLYFRFRSYLGLTCGGEEVWLVYPESKWVMIITPNQGLMFTSGQVACKQKVLIGFNISVDELLA